MPPAGFEKIDRSQKQFFGPRKLLMCGFSAKAQTTFTTLLEMVGLQSVDLVWVSSDQNARTIEDLMQEPHGFGQGVSSDLPMAIIVAGIAEIELHQLMSGCRQAKMPQALWATLTPVSKEWPLSALLEELEAERRALAQAKRP